MEEKDKNIILTDEELKEVTGGGKIADPVMIQQMTRICGQKNHPTKCMAAPDCAWIINRCLPNPDKYEYRLPNP